MFLMILDILGVYEDNHQKRPTQNLSNEVQKWCSSSSGRLLVR
jgi:hypothetical protein